MSAVLPVMSARAAGALFENAAEVPRFVLDVDDRPPRGPDAGTAARVGPDRADEEGTGLLPGSVRVFAISAFAVAAIGCSATPSTTASESTLSAEAKDPRIKEVAVTEGPTDITLQLERQVGITDCLLPAEQRSELERLGWELIRCDRLYAVAIADDRIGESPIADAPRQAAMLTILPQHTAGQIIETMSTRARDGLSGEAKAMVLRRFKVSPRRSQVFVTGLVDESGVIHGSVSIALSDGQVCDFKYPDMPFPQSECYRRVGNVVLKLRTNSTDFEAIQSVLSPIAQLGWRI